MKEKFVKRGRFSKKDQSIINQFLKQNFPSGFFDAKEVLELARSVKSPIHKYFDWTDSSAAEKYRLIQAQRLIRCVVVEINETPTRKYVTPVFVSLNGDEGRKYVEVNKAMKVPEIWTQVLSNAMRDAAVWKRRYANLKELHLIYSAIDKTEKKLKGSI